MPENPQDLSGIHEKPIENQLTFYLRIIFWFRVFSRVL
jgi:hypothetical protein